TTLNLSVSCESIAVPDTFEWVCRPPAARPGQPISRCNLRASPPYTCFRRIDVVRRGLLESLTFGRWLRPVSNEYRREPVQILAHNVDERADNCRVCSLPCTPLHPAGPEPQLHGKGFSRVARRGGAT